MPAHSTPLGRAVVHQEDRDRARPWRDVPLEVLRGDRPLDEVELAILFGTDHGGGPGALTLPAEVQQVTQR